MDHPNQKRTGFSARLLALRQYRSQRKTWPSKAAYHIIRFQHGLDPMERYFSAVWLKRNQVPPDGDPQYIHSGDSHH
jgi:hypothetical protein